MQRQIMNGNSDILTRLLPTNSQLEEFLLNRCIAFESSEAGQNNINNTADKKVIGNFGTKNIRNVNHTKGACL